MTIIYVCVVVLDYSDEYPGIILLDVARKKKLEKSLVEFFDERD